MGCHNSKEAEEARGMSAAGGSRRRLSVGPGMNPMDVGVVVEVCTEEERIALKNIEAEHLEHLVEAYAGPKGQVFSIASVTESKAESMSFKDKKREVMQTKAGELKTTTMGFTCRKGLKPEMPNQDSWLMLKVETKTAKPFALYGVFDGHGQQGHEISAFVQTLLPKMLIKEQEFIDCLGKKDDDDTMKRVLESVFKRLQEFVSIANRARGMEASSSGTTCTIAVHDVSLNTVHIANVADSTGVIGVEKGREWHVDVVTRDHKPELEDERARILRSGGRVVFDGYANHRIYAKDGKYPGLNMSRCFGDLLGHECGCVATPEVYTCTLTRSHKLLLLCSDGVWEFIPPDEALSLVKKYLASSRRATAQEAADKLAQEAWDRWIKEEDGQVVDDITVMLIQLGR